MRNIKDSQMEIHHTPVFLEFINNELLEKTDTNTKRKSIIDATLGEGGHTLSFLQKGYRVVGIDRDEKILEKAKKRLLNYKENFNSHHCNFSTARPIFENYNSNYQLALFDLGISMFHYRESGRGFSFQKSEPLDMRLDSSLTISAYDIVNTFKEEEIANILYEYGGEKKSRQIARKIVEVRQTDPIKTSWDLTYLIKKFYPPGRAVNPATKSFQALRIYVNSELKALEEGISAAIDNLGAGSTVAVISYHSLEDKIVKEVFSKYIKKRKNINKYKEKVNKDSFQLWSKKPILPSVDEINKNKAARSAKLRIITKIT